MKKCIIFGAGFYGKGAYYKLKKYYEITYYVDNNNALQGKHLHNIEIISAEQLKEITASEVVDIFICSQAYFDIVNQLIEMGLNEYYVMLEGFLYHTDENEVMIPMELENNVYYHKETNENNILFVQNTACIRTHKIAALMKQRGYKVFLLYTIAPPKSNNADFETLYEKVYTVFTANTLIDFVNNSEFDLIHSSNEPDSLTNYLLMTNKKVIFDTHDMISLRGNDRIEALTLEYIANTKSIGVLYTSPAVADIAMRKFSINSKKIFVLPNLMSEQIKIKKRYEKLSKKDGQIHCVYEGGIEGKNKKSHRYFEEIWKKITDCGIHIHFYSQSDEDYCFELEQKSDFLHFEGNVGSKELATEMTKYDCGLAIFNVNDSNRAFLETGTANKVYEYINSGLPMIVGDIESYKNFVTKYDVGAYLKSDENVKEQIQAACEIKISNDFLEKNRLTMDSYGDELEKFYRIIMERG